MAVNRQPSGDAVMANPTLTAEALRNLISEVVAEALAKRPDTAARSALPKADRERVDYDALAIKAFRKAGYGEVKPRIDTKTYNLWIADGPQGEARRACHKGPE